MVKCFLFLTPAFVPSALRQYICVQNVILPMLQASWTFLESWTILDLFGLFQTILNHFTLSRTISDYLDHIRLSWTILDHHGQYWII